MYEQPKLIPVGDAEDVVLGGSPSGPDIDANWPVCRRSGFGRALGLTQSDAVQDSLPARWASNQAQAPGRLASASRLA
jgi:hypothetical protein